VRSKAHYKAHPIHPSLIPFPFAFLSGALLFDVLGLITGRIELYKTGANLTVAGIAFGLLAAVPGIIDYLYTVPPESSGKKRATKHAIGNVTALVLFAAAWLLRRDDLSPSALGLVLETAGAAVLVYSGYLGGTLVTRNMISVDHRYANAGKWQETTLAAAADGALVVGHKDDLEEDQMKLLRINGRRIVLARTADGYTAFDDGCTHRGGSLAGGVLVNGTVQCLWHGSQFDANTGKVACGPAKKVIKAYEVRQSSKGELMLVKPPK
jgi:uncharacterized membrane protein/nitrite reductase/ring-hydroxylating ferredoxin subunit